MKSVMVRYKDLDFSNMKWLTDFCVEIPTVNSTMVVGFEALDDVYHVEDLIYYAYDRVAFEKSEAIMDEDTYEVDFGEDHDKIIEAVMSLMRAD